MSIDEHWGLCHDCDLDAWLFEEGGCEVHEDFYVHDDLWNSACPDDPHGDDGFMLCIGCFERRLGRKLRRGDFKAAPHDLFGTPPSRRFLERYGDLVPG